MGHHVHLPFTWGSVDLTSGPHAWTPGPVFSLYRHIYPLPWHLLYKQFSLHAPLPFPFHLSPPRVVPSLPFTARFSFNSKLGSRLTFPKTYRHPLLCPCMDIFFLLVSSCGMNTVSNGSGGRRAGQVGGEEHGMMNIYRPLLCALPITIGCRRNEKGTPTPTTPCCAAPCRWCLFLVDLRFMQLYKKQANLPHLCNPTLI